MSDTQKTFKETIEKPEVSFILKENSDDKGEYIQVLEYPFQALGGLPSVGDLVKFDKDTYRIYLRNFDYSDIKDRIKIYFYVIRVIE